VNARNPVKSEVQTNDFTGFLDLENVGIAVSISFLSALEPSLRAIIIHMAAIFESNMTDTGSSN